MKSARLGKRTSAVEVSNVSKHGFWLLIGEEERFLAFDDFPWFQNAGHRSAPERRVGESSSPVLARSGHRSRSRVDRSLRKVSAHQQGAI